MRLHGSLLSPDEARKEIERRKSFERYRYYKTPEYFEDMSKSSAHTKLLCCPNKVGKSTFAMMNAYWYAMGCHPHRKIAVPNTTWLMGPTIAHVNEVFLDGMREWGISRFWKSYAEKKGKITWLNGSITYVKSYDERKNLQGRTIKTAFIDEECPNDIWMEIVFRFKAGQQMDRYITATPVEGEEWFADGTTVRERPGTAVDLERAIAALPERARTVFVLHDVEGYKHIEIAEVADMAVGTSKAQLSRARRLLRKALAT